MSVHTRPPWLVNGRGERHWHVESLNGQRQPLARVRELEDADRIVSCVNGCTEIPNPSKLFALVSYLRDKCERDDTMGELARGALEVLGIEP